MSSKRRCAAGFVSGIATITFLTGCGGVQDASSETEASSDSTDAAMVAPVANMQCDEGAEATGTPIVVGGSLSLTGPLAPTARVHDAVAEIVVDWVNSCGGIEGKPLEWRVLDDQSTPAQVASNYERLLGDGVDLVMGPYGGAAILAGAGPVTEAGYAYPTATNGTPDRLIGENHFPSWQIGGGVDDPDRMFDAQAQTVVDALKASGNPPASVFFALSKFPTTLSFGSAVQTALDAEGVTVAGSVQYDLGTTDFSSIATRIASEDPDLVYLGALGADVTNFYQAFDAIGYTPRNVYATLPAPATIAGLGESAEGIMLSSIYEHHAPLGDTDIARYFAQSYSDAAEAKDVFPVIETQAAAGFAAWQILISAVSEVGVDNSEIIAWLNENEVSTIVGPLSFDGYNNEGTDLNRVAQVQDGKRFLVWPEDVAGAEISLEPGA